MQSSIKPSNKIIQACDKRSAKSEMSQTHCRSRQTCERPVHTAPSCSDAQKTDGRSNQKVRQVDTDADIFCIWLRNPKHQMRSAIPQTWINLDKKRFSSPEDLILNWQNQWLKCCSLWLDRVWQLMHASISSSPFQRAPINLWTQNSNGSPHPAVGGSTYKTEAAKGATGPHPLLSHLYRYSNRNDYVDIDDSDGPWPTREEGLCTCQIESLARCVMCFDPSIHESNIDDYFRDWPGSSCQDEAWGRSGKPQPGISMPS